MIERLAAAVCATAWPTRRWSRYPGHQRFPVSEGVEAISLPELAALVAESN